MAKPTILILLPMLTYAKYIKWHKKIRWQCESFNGFKNKKTTPFLRFKIKLQLINGCSYFFSASLPSSMSHSHVIVIIIVLIFAWIFFSFIHLCLDCCAFTTETTELICLVGFHVHVQCFTWAQKNQENKKSI